MRHKIDHPTRAPASPGVALVETATGWDITRARRGLHGAEAILKLRAIASDNDFDQYCNHHFTQGRQRNQDSRYGHGLNPRAA